MSDSQEPKSSANLREIIADQLIEEYNRTGAIPAVLVAPLESQLIDGGVLQSAPVTCDRLSNPVTDQVNIPNDIQNINGKSMYSDMSANPNCDVPSSNTKINEAPNGIFHTNGYSNTNGVSNNSFGIDTMGYGHQNLNGVPIPNYYPNMSSVSNVNQKFTVISNGISGSDGTMDFGSRLQEHDATNNMNPFCTPSCSKALAKHVMQNQQQCPIVPSYANGWACSPAPSYTRGLMATRKTIRKPKRVRTAFTTDQLMQLEEEFGQCRFIDRNRRNELAAAMGVAERVIKIWFQNRRMKLKKDQMDTRDEAESTTTPEASNMNDVVVPGAFEKEIYSNGGVVINQPEPLPGPSRQHMLSSWPDQNRFHASYKNGATDMIANHQNIGLYQNNPFYKIDGSHQISGPHPQNGVHQMYGSPEMYRSHQLSGPNPVNETQHMRDYIEMNGHNLNRNSYLNGGHIVSDDPKNSLPVVITEEQEYLKVVKPQELMQHFSPPAYCGGLEAITARAVQEPEAATPEFQPTVDIPDPNGDMFWIHSINFTDDCYD